MYKCQNQTEMAVKLANKLNLLIKGTRSAVQKPQVTVDTKNSQQTKKYV